MRKIFKNGILICGLLFLQNSIGQVFNQSYANIVNQCLQSNITTNLTQYEALGVKYRGTPALENAYQWLVDKYTSFGYTASQISTDTYSYLGSTCKNVVVTKIGTLYPNTYVIVCGHYDSITGTGTNDNGSGVVSILEMARLLQNVPTQYSIKFINFSGEEDGLKGSQHYVTNVVNGTTPKMNIRLVFNIDEVGGVAGMVNNNITCERDTGTPTSNNAASNVITQELITCVGLYSPLNTTLSYAYGSDYMPFEDNNEVITGFFETNETPYKHTANDLLVNMDPVYNFNVAKAAIGATLHFAVAEPNLNVDSEKNDFQISFFPNPVKGKLNINSGRLNATSYEFSLYNLEGKLVLNKTIQNPKQIEVIDVSNLSSGLYMGIIESGDNRVSKKVLLE